MPAPPPPKKKKKVKLSTHVMSKCHRFVFFPCESRIGILSTFKNCFMLLLIQKKKLFFLVVLNTKGAFSKSNSRKFGSSLCH